MVDSIATTSLLGHRPLCKIGTGCKDGLSRRTVGFCQFPVRKFIGQKLVCVNPKKWGMDRSACFLVKAQATELTREANKEEERLPRLNFPVDTSVYQKPGSWPPPNKADNPWLHNPLLRQERLGAGWLGAIFEWEGVIVEDNPDLETQAWVALSQEEGEYPPPPFTLRRIEGMKSEQAISEVLCWSRDPSELRRMASRKEEIYQGLQGGNYRLRSGSREFVDVLLNYKIPMALVSTRPRGALENAMRSVEFEGFFNVIVAAEDVYRGKPDPEMYVYAAQLLSFIPERCIVFGNSNLTIEAAHDAHMKCVAVASKHPTYELGAADMVVTQLNELSVVDLKNLAAVELDEFGGGEPELMIEEEEDETYPSTAVGFYDDDSFWLREEDRAEVVLDAYKSELAVSDAGAGEVEEEKKTDRSFKRRAVDLFQKLFICSIWSFRNWSGWSQSDSDGEKSRRLKKLVVCGLGCLFKKKKKKN